MACLFSVCFCELNYTLSEYDSAFVTLQSCRLPSLNCIDRKLVCEAPAEI